jgi:hypothetical protein
MADEKATPGPKERRSKQKRWDEVKKNDLDLSDKVRFDAEVNRQYSVCDIELPVIGHPCDKLSYAEEGSGVSRVGTILLWIVVILDVVVDIFFVLWHVAAGFAASIPVIGPLIGAVEGLELDDIVDFFSLVVVFLYCGPVVSVIAIPEFAEGILEIIPFWAFAIFFWKTVVRPSRKRGLKLKEKGILTSGIDETAIEEVRELYEDKRREQI